MIILGQFGIRAKLYLSNFHNLNFHVLDNFRSNNIICCWIFRYIKKQVYKDGHTGKVAFDNNGDRIYAEYDIVNVKQVAMKDAIGKYYFDNVIKDNLFL